MNWSTQDMLSQAEQAEAGAAQLRADADNAAQVLADRGWPNVDAAAWAVEKRAAADAAERYAAQVREQYADGRRPTEQEYRQAERVADAANLGGILIDGRKLDEAARQSPWPATRPRTGPTYGEQKAAEIEGSGAFTHVAGEIDGVEQVPFWRLGGSTDTAAGGAHVEDVQQAEEAAHGEAQGRADQAAGTVDTSRTADRDYVGGLAAERTAQVDAELAALPDPGAREHTYTDEDVA